MKPCYNSGKALLFLPIFYDLDSHNELWPKSANLPMGYYYLLPYLVFCKTAPG